MCYVFGIESNEIRGGGKGERGSEYDLRRSARGCRASSFRHPGRSERGDRGPPQLVLLISRLRVWLSGGSAARGEGWHGGHAEPRELTGSSEAERGQGMATGPGRGKAPREGAPVASGKGATGPGPVPRGRQRNSAGDESPLPGKGSGRDARDPSPGWRPGPLGSSRCHCIEGGRGGTAGTGAPLPPLVEYLRIAGGDWGWWRVERMRLRLGQREARGWSSGLSVPPRQSPGPLMRVSPGHCFFSGLLTLASLLAPLS